MRYLFWLTVASIFFIGTPLQAMELKSLADCAVKVFGEINRTGVWSGKQPEGCLASLYVEKRPEGIFVTSWHSATSEQGWARISLLSAMDFSEVARRKELDKGVRDITARTARIERCFNSILQVNDPLECRDSGTKSYSAGEEIGIEYKRRVWLEDNGRTVVAEHAYGDVRTTVSPPADLFGGPSLPPGTSLNIHVFDTE